MNESEIRELTEHGENAFVEFKTQDVRPDGLARKMAAFSNYLGGLILIGVEDNGTVSGVNKENFEEWIANRPLSKVAGYPFVIWIRKPLKMYF